MSGRLARGVADQLIEKEEYIEMMQHPKVAAAIQRLKVEPGCFQQLCAEDEELADLFAKMQAQMVAAEAEYGVDQGTNRERHEKQPLTPGAGARIFDEDEDDAPPLLSPAEVEAEEARALGSKAFSAGQFVDACIHYERACALEPEAHLHFSNLAAARLKCGRLRPALEAARECMRLAPRFAKGYLRCGQALKALGDRDAAADVLKQGLQRAEGAVYQAIAQALADCGERQSKPAETKAIKQPLDPRNIESVLNARAAPIVKAQEEAMTMSSAPRPVGLSLGNGHIFDIL